MSSRHSAARPNQAGENFARTHHNETDYDKTRVKFDVRNPSILAPESREDDAILDADVIGTRHSTKRGAVNLDGYDSDSDHETFNAKAANRKKGKVDFNEQLDNYDAAGQATAAGAGVPGADDDDDDMFAVSGDAGPPGDAEEEGDDAGFDRSGKKKKDVRFLDVTQIVGQDHGSKSGGHIRLDEEESDDDETEAQLAAEEEGLDDEVGAGGRKRNAPKVEAFNLKAEMEEGQFDQSGNYVRRAGDPDAIHDNWLAGVSKKEMKKAAEAHEKREAEARKQRLAEADVLVSDLLNTLIARLEPSETPLEAIARFGRHQTKTKKIPKWKLKKMNKGNAGDMEVDNAIEEDPEQARIKEAITAVTDAADGLFKRDYEDIYDQDRELLMRAYRRETGEDWVDPEAQQQDDESNEPAKEWEFRWIDGRDDGSKKGPYQAAMMKAWQDSGYFGHGVEFRNAADGHDAWTTTATFV
ncbi:hypothetical protein E4U53_006645 [Claviceps sorghi]|nr:hypothetical protein E4U53_006645 [Claviceps sorghi]